MIILHGSSGSNYYNTVKQALLEKGIDFTTAFSAGSQDKEYLSKSPMGLIPCLQTGEGYLVETSVILDYLEERYPESPLLPKDAFQRAKVRTLVKVMDQYILTPTTRLYPEAHFGETLPEPYKAEVRPEIVKGMTALMRLATFDPYIAGKEFTQADIFLVQNLTMVDYTCQKIFGWKLLDDYPEVADLIKRLNQRQATKKVNRGFMAVSLLMSVVAAMDGVVAAIKKPFLRQKRSA